MGGLNIRGDFTKTGMKVRSSGGGGGGIQLPNIVRSGLLMQLEGSAFSGGSVWQDQSGNDHNAELVNGPTWNSSGWFEFNGTNQYAVLNNDAFVYGEEPERTLSTWVLCQGADGVIIAYGVPASHASFGQGNFSSTGTNRFYWISDGDVWAPNTLPGGVWRNFVVTWKGGPGAPGLRLYVDGQFENNGGYRPTYTTKNVSYLARYVNPSNPLYFSGKIGEVLSYDRALTDTEILQNYNETKAKYGK